MPLRHPRCAVIVNGSKLIPSECIVTLSSHQSADKMEARFALDQPGGLDEVFWGSAAPIEVKVMATLDGSPGQALFSGNVDTVSIEISQRTVHVTARDKTAEMLDSKSNEKWTNKTPKEIVTEIAKRHGLKVQFSGDSGAIKAGLKYKDDHNRISDQDNEWNVVVKLARHVGCVAFVKGDTLYFIPVDEAQGDTYVLYYKRPRPGDPVPASNTVSIVMNRNLHLAKEIKVNHQSWRHKEWDHVESEHTLPGKGKGSLRYGLRSPNMTKEQSDELAKKRLAQIASHERTIEIRNPADLSLDPRMKLELRGTGTAWDQEYLIGEVEFLFENAAHGGHAKGGGGNGGARMLVRVRNQDKGRGKASKTK